MNDVVFFERAYKLLKDYADNVFASECVNSIETGLIVFEVVKIKDKALVERDYAAHYEIQKNITHGLVEGYNAVLDGLDQFVGEKIIETIVTTENCSYIVLMDSDLTQLIGILKSPYSNLLKVLSIHQENLARGFNTNRLQFDRKILKSW